MSFYDLYQAINCVTVGQMEGGEEYWSQGKRGAQDPKKKERAKQEQIPLT